MPGKSRKTAKKNASQRRRRKAAPEGAAEAPVREEWSFLRSAFATPLVGISIVGPSGERLFVNDCAVARTGYTREEYLALPISHFAVPEDFEQDMEGLRRMVAGEIDHQAIVASHEGTLTVDSEVGKGSTFRVELPAAPA